MASKYWIKLYHEILEDDKMGTLPDNLWRRAIELFLMAGQIDDDGNLPDTNRIAWKLRLSTETLQAELDQLEAVGILTKTETGWLVTNFQKRQAASEAKERVKQYRRRKEQQESNADVTIYNEESNVSVTKSNTNRKQCNAPDTDTDTESTPNGVGEISPGSPADKKPKAHPAPKPDGPKKQLMGTFQAETHMSLPTRKPTNSLWWIKIGEIEEIAGGDIELGKRLIRQAVKALKDKQLTIGGPESIIKTCRALAAGQTIGGNNGHETHYKKPTVDLEAYRHLEAQNQPPVDTG